MCAIFIMLGFSTADINKMFPNKCLKIIKSKETITTDILLQYDPAGEGVPRKKKF
jgi:hypothetical protein